jgi:hypothetical protein
MKDKLEPDLSLKESVLKTCCNRCKIHTKNARETGSIYYIGPTILKSLLTPKLF